LAQQIAVGLYHRKLARKLALRGGVGGSEIQAHLVNLTLGRAVRFHIACLLCDFHFSQFGKIDPFPPPPASTTAPRPAGEPDAARKSAGSPAHLEELTPENEKARLWQGGLLDTLLKDFATC
jgi:hypothetical protein